MSVEQRDDTEFFMQVGLCSLDWLINKVIEKKISAKEALLFMWMCSYGWKRGKSMRNPFTISMRRVAHQWGVEKGTVERWMGSLRELGVVEQVYRVKDRRTGDTVPFSTHGSAWNFKNEHCGDMLSSHFKLNHGGFIVSFTGEEFEDEDYE